LKCFGNTLSVFGIVLSNTFIPLKQIRRQKCQGIASTYNVLILRNIRPFFDRNQAGKTKTDCILFTQSNKKSDKIYTREYIMEIEIEASLQN